MSDTRSSRQAALEAVLAPGQPIADAARFCGRTDSLAALFDVVGEPGRHAMVFGDLGFGKTSFLNIAAGMLHDAGAAVLRADVASGKSFSEMIRAAAGDIRVAPNMEMRFAPITSAAVDVDPEESEPLAGMLPEGDFDGGALAELLTTQLAGPFVVIVDSYDCLADPMTDRAFADLIKGLGEREADTTVVLAGTADVGEDLTGEHDKIFPYVTELPLRLLRPDEILFLLDRAGDAAGLSFSDDTRKLLIAGSLGLPAMVQELTRRSAEAALGADADIVTPAHLTAAMQGAMAGADPAVRDAFDMLVGDETDDDFARTLYAIAVAHTDWFGRFFKPQITVSLRHRYPELAQDETEIAAFLDSLSGDDDQALLRKNGTEYRFRDIRMKQFLVMLYLSRRFAGAGSDATAARTVANVAG